MLVGVNVVVYWMVIVGWNVVVGWDIVVGWNFLVVCVLVYGGMEDGIGIPP